MTDPRIIDEAASIEDFAAIWNTPLPPTAHRVKGLSVDIRDGQHIVTAATDHDGVWRDIPTPFRLDPDRMFDPDYIKQVHQEIEDDQP